MGRGIRQAFRRVLHLAGMAVMAPALSAGPHAPGPGEAGTTAIRADDPRIVNWASSVVEYLPGDDLEAQWMDESEALGAVEPPESADVGSVVSLGRGGSLTLAFGRPIIDGPGHDFAVFENAFSGSFLELAFVEVSADGETFVRFPAVSLTGSDVGPFGLIDPTDVDGLAGKYPIGQGVPFDLADLGAVAPATVGFVRLVDVVGGTSLDSRGEVIHDPFPTIGSAGFDLDGVGVIQEEADIPLAAVNFAITPGVDDSSICLTWRGNSWKRYRLLSSADLERDRSTWAEETVITGRPGWIRREIPAAASPTRFYLLEISSGGG